MATMERILLCVLCAAAPLGRAAAADALPELHDAVAEYARRAAAGTGRCAEGETLALPVATGADAPLDAAYDAATGRLRIFHRMSFNHVTEGWNWHPETAAAGGDYYLFKYLPLGSTGEDRGAYPAGNVIGAPVDYRVQWRYDYFFAFDNPYEFYRREAADGGDDIGFAAEIALPAAAARRLAGGDLRLAITARLARDCLAESTTFWKALPSNPVDFTLKKRYLVGRLAEVWFYDAATHQVLARLAPR